MRNRLLSALSKLAGRRDHRRSTSRPARAFRPRLNLERLEQRDVPAFFFVTSGADSGPGTLRQALTDANNFMLNPDNWAEIRLQVPDIIVKSPLPEQFISLIVINKDPANPGNPTYEGEV